MHPYAELTPDRILDAVEGRGLPVDGRLLALNSYENRVYQVGIEGQSPIIAKFYRPERWSDAQILEEHRFAQELAAAEVPVVAPLDAGGTLHRHEQFRFALFPRRGGRAPELDDGEVLEWIGRFLGRIHVIGQATAFHARPALDVETFIDEPRAFLLKSGMIPAELVEPYRAITGMAREEVQKSFARAGDLEAIRLHGDCHAGNILWTDAGPHFVDLDDCRNGPAVQDLWMLLSGDRQAMGRQLRKVLAGYEQFAEFDDRQLHLVEALRTMRMIHYAAWLGRRWDDPAFPAAFPWFNSRRYWEEHILQLREQAAAMSEPPLAAVPNSSY
jgi:Ser/Thr protein kinase RdoA (MazF antagonist)